jgi:cytochrome c oxidase subunit I+III
MIVFAFPPVILATALLELERAFDWPFFIAERGGQPLLWQHLFWLFGHPDVYIIFLPAAGLLSMMIPTLARTRLVGYSWVVWAMIGTGLVSFTLWIHHMFATGMSHMSTALSSAASMAVAIPTAVQVFAWLATLQQGHVQKSAPTWFIIGFFGIFVLGGLSGVMIAVVPYDWQVHDTYFIVAHLHYVLIGGMVFPVFAAIYYWAPLVAGKPLSERMGKWGCALMFIGFTVTFLPMHWTGLLGMPRRVWTYVDGLGWDSLNLISTVGSFVLATGFAIVFIDLLLHFRVAGKVDTNPWNAGTLEWLPMDTYATRSIPRVRSREPLWDQPNLREQVDSGQHYLPGTVTGERETIVTSAKDAKPQYLMRLPGPSWWPLLAGVGTAAFFLLLTVKLMIPAAIGGAIALISIFIWLWEVDPPPTGKRYPIGDGIELPDYMTGPRSHSWWGVTVLNLVDATIFACLIFTYFYLWEGAWPPPGAGLPSISASTLAIVSWLIGGGLLWFANRSLRNRRPLLFAVLLVAVTLLAWAAFGAHYLSLQGASVAPDANSYGAVLYTILAWHGLHVIVVTLAIAYTLARQWAGLITHEHRVVFDNTRLLWLCAAAEAIVGLLVIHAPRLVG